VFAMMFWYTIFVDMGRRHIAGPMQPCELNRLALTLMINIVSREIQLHKLYKTRDLKPKYF